MASAQSFSYPDFSSLSGLVLNLDAIQSGNATSNFTNGLEITFH